MEKIALISGDAGCNDSTMAVERLGIPKLLMSDGGDKGRLSPCCVLPSAIALAATWDREVAARAGKAVGLEARARGIHIHLYPGVNISRIPTCGRSFEYFGEDPNLAGKMVSSFTRAIEDEGVVATIKHFACNNQEWCRINVSAEIDERTLQEIYLAPFRYAVQEGRVSAVMCSYNRINGIHTSENRHLLQEILKDQWGFRGIAISDWDSVHSILALGRGLDLEMPFSRYFTSAAVSNALEQKTLAMAQLDESVRRILRVIVSKGFMDRPQKREDLPLDSPESCKTALDASREAIVLLKNGNGLLPLKRSAIHKIAVFGRLAVKTPILGNGSGAFIPFHQVDFLEGIRRAAGKEINVEYVPAKEVPADFGEFPFCRVGPARNWEEEPSGNRKDLTMPPDAQPGFTLAVKIKGDRFNPPNLPLQTVRNINFTRGKDSDSFLGIPNNRHAAVSFSGFLVAPEDSDWQVVNSNSLWCIIGDQDYNGQHSAAFIDYDRAPLHLKKNVPVPILFTGEVAAGRPAQFQATIRKVPVPDVSAARDADVAIVVVGRTEGEGKDVVFELPADELSLINAVCAANPHTIIVNQSAAAVEMASWISKPGAVLQCWFLGQEGGTALGEILFGDANPSGHLPVTFERRFEDYPAIGGGPATYPGIQTAGEPYPKVRYSEGIFVGYRGTDKAGREPLFPFGHGLSYTTFQYNNLRIRTVKKGSDPVVSVQFDVKNTGRIAGAEVPQVYVSDTHSPVPRPIRELKGFSRVMLAPGEVKTVTIDLNKDAFAFYDTARKGWRITPGDFGVSVGASSRDLRLEGRVSLHSGAK